jgi:hypothetical protein
MYQVERHGNDLAVVRRRSCLAPTTYAPASSKFRFPAVPDPLRLLLWCRFVELRPAGDASSFPPGVKHRYTQPVN